VLVVGRFGVEVVAAVDVTIDVGAVGVTTAGFEAVVSTRAGVVLRVGLGVPEGPKAAATAPTLQHRTRSRPTTPPIKISALAAGALSRPGRVGSCTTAASGNVRH
jgi:hypothetical protein